MPGGSARPTCETLEGRALLASYTALDPEFGQGGVALGVADGSDVDTGSAVAIGAEGKIVEVGTIRLQPFGSSSYPQLAVRRYNPDGSVDTSFGANGQASIALPAGALGIQVGPPNVVVQADGSILVAATAALPGTTPGVPRVGEGFVAKLTATGQLDAGFGTSGKYVFIGTTISVSTMSVDAVGNVLVMGGTTTSPTSRAGPARARRATHSW